ncbi:Mannosyltransferase, DXD [Beauveria brongniartii RCEF 3172]|uniref:GPI mannosyltransferase 1 n=1 Tax=Beauveria brongniartii RCEF 3172 TaxID=1081107 RepID=A0A166WET3_9HYPO|nr:Mannosyltransferase, DXD [Beauveria brongniartii RCEF 3172]
MAKTAAISAATSSSSSSSSRLCSLHALFDPIPLFTLAALLRLLLLLYGAWQDAHSALKYTDIDYLVFTDAARSVSLGSSPYARATYRYTPLLAWLLLPTAAATTTHPLLFHFGKLLFALADLAAGWLTLRLLLRGGGGSPPSPPSPSQNNSRMTASQRAGAFAALWLWNPMVATMSTRGSAEALLGVLTMALLWAVARKKVVLAGVVLGLAVHVKIYPFIYAPAVVWWMDEQRMATDGGGGGGGKARKSTTKTLLEAAMRFVTPARIKFTVASLATFMLLNVIMYSMYPPPPVLLLLSPELILKRKSYGTPFLVHTYLHHGTRIDHRHNFSLYNILLYINSATPSGSVSSSLLLRTESIAFVPQLLLSCVLIPIILAKKDIATSMMAQTFAFVTFNKVCTSQYFLWYMIFLPLYLPGSSLLRNPKLGISALLLWVVAQGAWLQQGYELEFLGRSTFVPGLWLASLAFFLVNCWILGIIISDGVRDRPVDEKTHTE